jgi:hypothetical protein
MNLDEINEFARTVVMSLITNESATACGMDRLLKECGVAHADKLAAIDVIAFFDEDVSFAASGIVGSDEKKFWRRGRNCRQLTQDFFAVLNPSCLCYHF